MWYSCTTLAIELKIEVLYKRDCRVMNMFCGVVGDMNKIMLYVYKINTKNRLTRFFYGVYLKHDWGYKGAFAKQLQSNYKTN